MNPPAHTDPTPARRASQSSLYREDEESDTSPGIPLTSMPPLPDDENEALGVLYAAVARQGRHIESIKRDYGAIRTEVIGIRKDLEIDRGELVEGASRQAAKHSSNRTAAVMGTLFTLYELASPYVHELWRLMHHG